MNRPSASRRRWLVTFAVIVAVIAIRLLMTPHGSRRPVLVLFDADASIAPPASNQAPHSFRAEPLLGRGLGVGQGDDASRYRRMIDRAIKKYPDGAVAGELGKVYLLRYLEVDGLEYGGTSDPASGSLFVVAPRSRDEEAAIEVERVFQYEFASLLFLRYGDRFPAREWDAANKPGLMDTRGGRAAISGKWDDHGPSADSIAMGFIQRYSQSGVREDFCTVVTAMACGDQELWKAVCEQPNLRKKAEIAAGFLAQVDSRISWQWFERLRARPDAAATMRWALSK